MARDRPPPWVNAGQKILIALCSVCQVPQSNGMATTAQNSSDGRSRPPRPMPDEPVGTAERREVVESKWKALDMDRRRMLVDELVTVTIEPIMPGHVKFDPDLVRIEPRRD